MRLLSTRCQPTRRTGPGRRAHRRSGVQPLQSQIDKSPGEPRTPKIPGSLRDQSGNHPLPPYRLPLRFPLPPFPPNRYPEVDGDGVSCTPSPCHFRRSQGPRSPFFDSLSYEGRFFENLSPVNQRRRCCSGRGSLPPRQRSPAKSSRPCANPCGIRSLPATSLE